MAKPKLVRQNRLSERMVRNDDIFCSLLFDQGNRTLRVVDFRGGNFQSKHAYLERVLMSEGMRKVFTLIERDDMTGWQRVGYQREGSIPGYYKRSDAYIMSRIYDEDFDPKVEQGEDLPANKVLLADIRNLAKEIGEQKGPPLRMGISTEAEAAEVIQAEMKRLADKAKSKKAKSAKGKVQQDAVTAFDLTWAPPIFPQFSREVEHYYFVVQNKRTKQANAIGAEYQDCFGNAKVELFFTPQNRADQCLARDGISAAIDILLEIGAVSIFALGRVDDLAQNAILAAAGFKNSGWLTRQILTPDKPVDQILWTRKLV